MRILQFLILVSAFVRCGPMNTRDDVSKKVGDLSPAAATVLTEGTHLSKANQFYIHISFERSENPEKASAPDVGENNYRLRLVRADDLRSLSESAKVTATYEMPEMPEMGQSEAQVVRQSDGSFTMTLFFSMPGLWRINLKFEDGLSRDEYAFEATL